jgi:hypothetical protein
MSNKMAARIAAVLAAIVFTLGIIASLLITLAFTPGLGAWASVIGLGAIFVTVLVSFPIYLVSMFVGRRAV